MKYLFAAVVVLGLAAALLVSEAKLIRYVVRCEMRRLARVLEGPVLGG